jgi:hypothetical protein
MTKIVAALITTITCFFILKIRGVVYTFLTNIVKLILNIANIYFRLFDG